VLTGSFAISRTEVTQGQFAAVMGTNPTEFHTDDVTGLRCRDAGIGDRLPVACVDWFEAVAYCNRLSELRD